MANPKDRAVQDLAPPIARHEFGHYVVARVLGFRVGDVSLSITYPSFHSGSSVIEPATNLATPDQIASYIENRVIVLYAGVQAQTLRNGKINNDEALMHLGARPGPYTYPPAAQDYAKARELIHMLRSITCEISDDAAVIQKQLDEIDLRVWNRAAQIVEQENDLIFMLGKMLSSRIKKSGVKETITKAELDASDFIKARFSI